MSASFSKLANVIAHHNIDLISSSATDLRSEREHVTVRQIGESQSEISSITAHNSVNVDSASVNGRIYSEWGHVSANQSKLGSVTARKSIDLINSSAIELRSELGNVIIRQTDGAKRIISHITACNKVVVENSIVENVTLYVDQGQKALLDVTNTKVSEKINIKVNESLFSKITRVFFSWSFARILNNEPKHFSILHKGTILPENIFFEGFDADEITSVTTNNGILVVGKKK